MAAQATLQQITDGLTALAKAIDPETFIYDFLNCFGFPKSTMTRLRAGNMNGSKRAGCVLLKKKVHFEALAAGRGSAAPSPANALAAAKSEKVVIANHPRFLIATDFKTVAAYDTKLAETAEFPIKELHENYTFFLPLAGMERAVVHAEIAADVRAAEHMAKLYDLVRADNPPKTNDDRHALNVFMTRLLFCYFAEDTGIFPQQAFTRAISQFTQADGSDVGSFIQDLFAHVSTPPKTGGKTKQHLSDFPYVNGGLFNDTKAKHAAVPRFTAKSRQRLIDLGVLDWSKINPDIFGSMFQAVVDVDKRGELGMHYTSVPNIMKVIGPLFLDDLNAELAAAKGSKGKLYKLLERLRRLRFLDPACGSGNFLIITYKELRRLEMRVFNELLHVAKQLPLELCRVHVNQFYGIELDDFAVQVAGLALWLAEHQMNIEFQKEFSKSIPSLPLKEGAHITQGNATRLSWGDVCPSSDNVELFVMGNPPYYGARMQDAEQKAEIRDVLAGHIDAKKVDYIYCWFVKAALYAIETDSMFAFVATSSLCQGEQALSLWPWIFEQKLEIQFAHRAFKWANNAKANAALSCIIVGVAKKRATPKRLIDGPISRSCPHINAYLVSAPDTFIERRNQPISALPEMQYGNMAIDGGALLFGEAERDQLLAENKAIAAVIRSAVGAEEFLNNGHRWCLWLPDQIVGEFKKYRTVKQRIDACRIFREGASDAGTRKLAQKPHQFREMHGGKDLTLFVPTVSSERRHYLPCGLLPADQVVIAPNQVIYNAPVWILGLVSSQMHIVWVRAVAGRLEDRIRYSSSICYNNFPFPPIGDSQRQQIAAHAEAVMLTREKWPDKSIADLYDPDAMPADLLVAHQVLDHAVDLCYRAQPFTSDEERLEHLFALYETMTATESAATHPATPKKRASVDA